MARISLKDIAKEIGVSSATVSLVLNGKDKEGRISEEVARKVRDVAERLNYRPNIAARSLRTGETKTLGLIVADISNPFFSKIARHVENIAGIRDYQVMFGSSDESNEKFKKLVDLFIEKYVDGVILAPPQDSEEVIQDLIRRKIPTVLIDRRLPGVAVNSVQIDNVGAAYSLTNILIEQGCKRIGFIAYNIGLPNIKKRYEGYCKALEANNISVDESLVHSVSFENFEKNIERSIESILKQNIDSIVFATNRVGVQSLLSLKRHPQYKKLKYASIDNSDEYKIADLPVICIEQPIEGISRRALDILFKYIDDPEYSEIENVTLQAKIVL